MQQKMGHFLLWSLVLALFCAIPLFGQTFGEITGHISDASGAAIPGATVTLTNTTTSAVRTTVSTDAGDYTFSAVAPGPYTVKVERASFKVTSSSVQVQVQQT